MFTLLPRAEGTTEWGCQSAQGKKSSPQITRLSKQKLSRAAPVL